MSLSFSVSCFPPLTEVGWRILQGNLKVRFFRLVGLGWRGNGRHLATAELTMISLPAAVSMTTQRGVSEDTEVEESLARF